MGLSTSCLQVLYCGSRQKADYRKFNAEDFLYYRREFNDPDYHHLLYGFIMIFLV